MKEPEKPKHDWRAEAATQEQEDGDSDEARTDPTFMVTAVRGFSSIDFSYLSFSSTFVYLSATSSRPYTSPYSLILVVITCMIRKTCLLNTVHRYSVNR